MRAAVLHGPADLRVEDRPVPDPGPTDVLVEVSHCGVCGTDLHFVIEGWGTPGSVGGHEWSGHVVAVGPDVDGWSIGDRVVGGPAATCGTCPGCRAGRLSLCTARPPVGSGPQNGAFADFDAVKVARFTPRTVEKVLENPAIVRNRQKVEAAINNARAFLKIQREFGSFDTYVWAVVAGKPSVNRWRKMSDVPATSKESDALSKDLKQRGFKFVGSTIVYAHMQATGLVNDHLEGCGARADAERERRRFQRPRPP